MEKKDSNKKRPFSIKLIVWKRGLSGLIESKINVITSTYDLEITKEIARDMWKKTKVGQEKSIIITDCEGYKLLEFKS